MCIYNGAINTKIIPQSFLELASEDETLMNKLEKYYDKIAAFINDEPFHTIMGTIFTIIGTMAVLTLALTKDLGNGGGVKDGVVLFVKGHDNMSISMSIYEYSEQIHKWHNITEVPLRTNDHELKSNMLIDAIQTKDRKHMLLYFAGTKKIRVDSLEFHSNDLSNQGHLISKINSTSPINMCEIDGKIMIKKFSSPTNGIALETFFMTVLSHTYPTKFFAENIYSLEATEDIETNCMVCLGNVVHFIGIDGWQPYHISYELKTKEYQQNFIMFPDRSLGRPEQIKAAAFKGNLYIAVTHKFSDDSIHIYEYDASKNQWNNFETILTDDLNAQYYDFENDWYKCEPGFETFSTDEPDTEFFIEANDDHLFVFYGAGNGLRYSDKLDTWIKLPQIHTNLADVALIRVLN